MSKNDDAPPTQGLNHRLVDLFEARAKARPDAIAVSHRDRALSYGELDRRANQFAHILRQSDVGTGDRIALAFGRSIEMIVALLAVLKAGACYVPLDPAAPPDRLALILENCTPKLLLTTRKAIAGLGSLPGVEALCLDDPAVLDSLSHQPGHRAPPPAADTGLAYIIYTSGSTGQPKGVAIPQSNVLALFDATQAIYDFGPQDVWTLFHSYAFDFSVWEIWGALLHGGRLVIVDDAVRMSPPALLDLLEQEQVTVLNQTPSAFYALAAAEAQRPLRGSALRHVIFGGEGLELARLQPWYDRHGDGGPQLVNMYGITETTVHVTWIRLDAALARTARGSLIGEGIPGWTVHLLDPALQPVTDGEVGEIFVSGPGVALGYVGRPDLTAERFLPCPFGPPGSRMYRSGDLARRPPEGGGLEYLGRADQQVKINGYRIEPGEVETALEALPEITQAAVAPRSRAGEPRLVAWLVPRDPAHRPGPSDLANALASRLPDYMTPSAFLFVDRLPLTLNGKLDRQALPSPWPDEAPVSDHPDNIPGRDSVEASVKTIFSEFLGGPDFPPDAGFFELGLRSMDLIKISARLQNHFYTEMTVALLLECGNVAKLVARLAHSREVNPPDINVTDRASQGRSALQRRRDARSRRDH